jgi:YfiR/HmsC-like
MRWYDQWAQHLRKSNVVVLKGTIRSRRPAAQTGEHAGAQRWSMHAGRSTILPKRYIPLSLLFFWICAAVLNNAQAQPENNGAEYQIKAAFLYKFCLYVEWPATAFAAADSPIVLGLAAPDDMIGAVENAIRGRVINGRQLQLRRIDTASDLAGLHLLFIARPEPAYLTQWEARAQGLPLLLVTESAAGLDGGIGINFAVQDNRVRFDVGLDAASRNGLRLSAQLLKVARTVRGEAGP